MLQQTLGTEDCVDEKALRKPDKRPRAALGGSDGTDRSHWAAPIYRYTSKISRQVLRFFKLCFSSRILLCSIRASYALC